MNRAAEARRAGEKSAQAQGQFLNLGTGLGEQMVGIETWLQSLAVCSPFPSLLLSLMDCCRRCAPWLLPKGVSLGLKPAGW